MLLTHPDCKKAQKTKNHKAKVMAARSMYLEHSTFSHIRVTNIKYQELAGEQEGTFRAKCIHQSTKESDRRVGTAFENSLILLCSSAQEEQFQRATS